jgi:osmotically-inducible protein OsmY
MIFRKVLPVLGFLLVLNNPITAYADDYDDNSKTSAKSYDESNTGRNAVDDDDETSLPEDQSNEQVHIDRTARIRREITSEDNFSTSAKNIKIVTLANGNVVLRGPVATESEKLAIEAIANRVGGSNVKVSSYLTVDKDNS